MASNAVDHFSWFQKFEPTAHLPDYITHAYLVGALLIVAALCVAPKLRKTRENLLPSSKFSVSTFFELVAEFMLGLMKPLLGHQATKYLPLIASIFVYVFINNLTGLIPGFQSATGNINTNFAVGFFVFLFYNAMGVKENGLSYLKHFFGPVWWLGWLFLVVELIGHAVRPVSLALRLTGNMTGDHMVFNIFSNLVPIGVPLVFLALGLFVSLVQAFVFSLLSVIYLALAVEHEH